jgi:hypothetical protein
MFETHALRVGLIMSWFNTLDLFSILQFFSERNLKKTFNFCWEEFLSSSQLWKSFLSNNEFSTEKRYFWGDTFFSTFPTSKELLMNKKVSSFFSFILFQFEKEKETFFRQSNLKVLKKSKFFVWNTLKDSGGNPVK